MKSIEIAAPGGTQNDYSSLFPFSPGKTSVSMLESFRSSVPHIPFSNADRLLLQLHLALAAARIGYDYDVKHIDNPDSLAIGMVQLTSKNFGYDFALLQSKTGSGFLGFPKNRICIYMSHCGADHYDYVASVRSLSKALNMIDAMYKRAAAAHLA